MLYKILLVVGLTLVLFAVVLWAFGYGPGPKDYIKPINPPVRSIVIGPNHS